MTHATCLTAVAVGGIALAAVLLTPRVVTLGARAGTALLDHIADRWVRL